MAKNDDKKKLPKKHIKNLEKLGKDLAKGKEIAKEKIRQDEKVFDSLDKAEAQLDKEKKIALAFSIAEEDDISEQSWIIYGGMVDRSTSICTSVDAFVEDLSVSKEESEQLGTAANMLDTLLSSSTATAGVAFKNDPFLAQHLISLEESNTINEHEEFIKSELNTMCPDGRPIFEKILIDWKTADPQIKYTSLLALRSLIFDQIFKNFSRESNCMKAPWFLRAKKTKKRGDIALRQKFCQAKYFMIGSKDENNLISAILLQVNSIAGDMLKHFEKLSEYGKYGENQVITDALFSDVLSAFSQCLEMRKAYYV